MNQSETEYRSKDHAPSQNDKLEAYFAAHANEWLDLPTLAVVITPTGIGAAVRSRVSDLRTKRGLHIQQVNNWATEDGVSGCHSRYRYVPNPFPAQDGSMPPTEQPGVEPGGLGARMTTPVREIHLPAAAPEPTQKALAESVGACASSELSRATCAAGNSLSQALLL